MPIKIGDRPISNAHRGIRLKIDQGDIRMGQPRDAEKCAAAQCAVRSIPGAETATVFRGVVYVRISGKWHRFRTSAALRLETIVYDRGGKFMPGEYDLLPVPVSELKRTGERRPRAQPAQTEAPRVRLNKPLRRVIIPGTRPTATSFFRGQHKD